MTARTTILGVEYEGTPMFGSLALMLHHMETRGEAEQAQALLNAHNRIRSVFGNPPVDLASQCTTANPMSMATLCPNALAALEGQGRAIDRVVTKTMGRAA